MQITIKLCAYFLVHSNPTMIRDNPAPPTTIICHRNNYLTQHSGSIETLSAHTTHAKLHKQKAGIMRAPLLLSASMINVEERQSHGSKQTA